MKKILVYPCGTEIGLEIYKAMESSPEYELWGGSSSYDHGRFVYQNHIDDLPFITDHSDVSEIRMFNKMISDYNFDLLYPAMDGVVMIFSRFREELTPVLIAPDRGTSEITRSKKKTYKLLDGVIPIPHVFDSFDNIKRFPVFIKPDQGQGSVGARKIISPDQLKDIDADRFVCMEYLPGEEYTIDCFTNFEGKLLFAKGRKRKRIRNGISVNAVFEENPIFWEYAEKINKCINQRGGWFFQLKEAEDSGFKLLEVASRIAGTSAITRCIGINLPLLTAELFNGKVINELKANLYDIELDRALHNSYKTNIDYHTVYVVYEDTLVKNNKTDPHLAAFLYQSLNEKRKLVLITKEPGKIECELNRQRLSSLFDEILTVSDKQGKEELIKTDKSVFIDSSFEDRMIVHERCGIPVFDVSMLECLISE